MTKSVKAVEKKEVMNATRKGDVKSPAKRYVITSKMASKPPMKTISHPTMKTPAGVKTKGAKKVAEKSVVNKLKK